MEKVAHILKDLMTGGVQSLVLDTARYCLDSGHPFVVIALGHDRELRGAFEQLGSSCYFVPRRFPYLDLPMILKIRRILLREKVDVVHAHHVTEGIAAYLATLGTSIKTIITFHVSPEVSSRRDNRIFRILAPLMDTCIAPSQAQKDRLVLAGYPENRIQVVHNGVYPARINRPPDKDLRKELGVKPDHILLGMTGNLHSQTRDPLTVCKALPQVFRQCPKARFVFFGRHQDPHTGENENYKACRRFCRNAGISHKVLFPGTETETADILNALDVFVYASLNDTFGIAVIEAMMKGIPVIVNDLDVLKEVAPPTAVHFYPTGDHKALENTIINLLSHQEKTRTMTQNAQQYAMNKYHIREYCNP